jgi:hypothetical protein
MSKEPKMQRVESFRYPRVFMQNYDGMPVYTITSPFIIVTSSAKGIIFGALAFLISYILVTGLSDWVPDSWESNIFVAGMLVFFAGPLISFFCSTRNLRFDSRDLSLSAGGYRYALTDIEAFTVEPHARARSPRTAKFRHTVSVLAYSGPLGVNKTTLAEVSNNDEHGHAAAIRAAVDWCGREVWDAHRQAGNTPAESPHADADDTAPEATKEKQKDEGDWPLSG